MKEALALAALLVACAQGAGEGTAANAAATTAASGGQSNSASTTASSGGDSTTSDGGSGGAGGQSASSAGGTGGSMGCTDSTQCAVTEYCDFSDDLCGAGVMGSCTVRPAACMGVYDPRCGCDDLPYSNACYAAMAGQDVDAFGLCN